MASLILEMQNEIKELEVQHEEYKEKLSKINAVNSSYQELDKLFQNKRKKIVNKYKLLAQDPSSTFTKMNNGNKIVVKGSPDHKTKFNDVDHKLIDAIRGDILTVKRFKKK